VSKSSWISSLNFRGLALFLRLRERSGEPQKQIESLRLRPGQVVLDYGCGIGSYSLPAARALGEEGTVYALDIHPLAVETVQKRSRQESLSNVRTIRSGLDTGLPDESVDVVLLYDVLHHVHDKGALVRELHRILKTDGLLSVIPDHMEESELLKIVQAGRRFSLQPRHTNSFEFAKQTNGKQAPVTGG
jgi:ubiquinone/menaquinone biosynthesis C-methylase UbiE